MDKERTYQTFVPSVDRKRMFDIPDRKGFCNILQLQTVFSKLNEYRHKLGQREDNRCQCGEIETTDHFINHCPTYRNTLWLNLSNQLGIHESDLYLLLSEDQNEEIPNWREVIKQEVATFIKAPGCFEQSASIVPPPSP